VDPCGVVGWVWCLQVTGQRVVQVLVGMAVQYIMQLSQSAPHDSMRTASTGTATHAHVVAASTSIGTWLDNQWGWSVPASGPTPLTAQCTRGTHQRQAQQVQRGTTVCMPSAS
jgi:hypothetical protein